MEAILNDLSLEEYDSSEKSLVEELIGVVVLKNSSATIGRMIKCHRNLKNIEVNGQDTLLKIIGVNTTRDQRTMIFSWMDRAGPFWCDSREANSDDYFEYDGQDVTDQGLGECARKQILTRPVSSFSLGNNEQFKNDLLAVQHGLAEEPLGLHNIQNVSGVENLKAFLFEQQPAPNDWKELIDFAKEKFQYLVFSDDLIDQIKGQPFSTCVSDRFIQLCTALQEIINSRDECRHFRAETNDLIEKYFHGEKGWFSDESSRDKVDFKNLLKFKNCHTGKKELFTYHGKIKTPQTRVYFDWPLTPDMEQIQIVYFGPKVTKH